jgi:hypothetical protein
MNKETEPCQTGARTNKMVAFPVGVIGPSSLPPNTLIDLV